MKSRVCSNTSAKKYSKSLVRRFSHLPLGFLLVKYLLRNPSYLIKMDEPYLVTSCSLTSSCVFLIEISKPVLPSTP